MVSLILVIIGSSNGLPPVWHQAIAEQMITYWQSVVVLTISRNHFEAKCDSFHSSKCILNCGIHSSKGLSPDWHQAITWTNDELTTRNRLLWNMNQNKHILSWKFYVQIFFRLQCVRACIKGKYTPHFYNIIRSGWRHKQHWTTPICYINIYF